MQQAGQGQGEGTAARVDKVDEKMAKVDEQIDRVAIRRKAVPSSRAIVSRRLLRRIASCPVRRGHRQVDAAGAAKRL